MHEVMTIWQASKQVPHTEALMASLRKAKLPLAYAGQEGPEEGSEDSRIVCIASVSTTGIDALIVSPSGLAYRLTDETLDLDFWKFAAEYYYLVTGNMGDRQHIAELVGIEAKVIKGKTLARGKGAELSALDLEDILDQLNTSLNTSQSSLF
ncbi:hypothetical protein ACKF11_13230 [Methylobacillus sp. Pita2]|uniref:hypothetical protein n=1 Tax=Methylobacillus sp. Pita2 TaxID=3383245 RepID=UPI0038B5C23E